MDLIDFSSEFHNDILLEAEDREGVWTEEIFLEKSFDYMVSSSFSENPCPVFFKKTGIRVDGYDFQEENGTIVLFVSEFDQVKSGKKMGKNSAEEALKRLENFMKKSFKDLTEAVDESRQEILDLIDLIRDKETDKIKLVLITNSSVIPIEFTEEIFENKKISKEIWDIQRTYSVAVSGEESTGIVLDFSREQKKIRALKLAEDNEIYDSFLLIFPGETVASLYGQYGTKLIEKNIRAFLQAKNRVNKGIRDTLKKDPEMFMAYNNGLSTTANSAVFEKSPEGDLILKKMEGWQIVNGGQTTASLYEASRAGDDLSKVYVQTKLCIIKEKEKENGIVPLISRYANSQTKVNESDFFANDIFNIKIEEFSRSVFVPYIQGKATTKWFYERIRGQYIVEKNRKKTKKEKDDFEKLYPRTQKFTKTEMAKYINAYKELPHTVSKGAEYNFNDFMRALEASSTKGAVNEEYYKKLIAKAVLFKRCDSVVRKADYGGFKANIVAYSVAGLNHITDGRVDLELIWMTQNISKEMENALLLISEEVFNLISSPPPGNKNVTQYCKQEKCWKLLKTKLEKIKTRLLNILKDDLLSENTAIKNEDKNEVYFSIENYEEGLWDTLYKWASENDFFDARTRQFMTSIGKQSSYKTDFTRKQKWKANQIIAEARELGFSVNVNDYKKRI